MDPSLKSLRDLFEKALRDYGTDHPGEIELCRIFGVALISMTKSSPPK